MIDASLEPLKIRVIFPTSLEDDPALDLTQVGATEVHVEEPHGVVPLLGIVVGAVIGVNALAELVMRWRDKHRCQQIIDVRGNKIETKVDCDIKDGRITIITSGDDKIEIVEAPNGFDLAGVLKTAISAGGSAAKNAAQAAGATVAG